MSLQSEEMNFHDVVRTLEEFTAETILTSLNFIPKGKPIPKLWIVAGGGWKNPVILNTFEEKLALKIPGCNVVTAKALGWNGDALEAQIFAYLAIRSRKGLPLSLPMTTGVPRPLTGGKWVTPFQWRLELAGGS
ncbi:Anhydro-N-acetylmuramic acid kinase [Candidatus Bealeia paramacronuclearis]|uniref:Anhydro-N-acetylmuramic acid kinase n=1 Tax=Candidatus Bealeia paramacronuclearis TaxID=1921001 RepID=A0ABZ2C5D4_9PROT|nr:Anhydro-N-acetylmuramic acid kinase [Candidatus Bealeia paramacronuclearis]